MAEEEKLILGQPQELGEIIIAPEVIEVIIGIAAAKVEGVYAMRGTLASNVNQLLGKNTHGKGVYLTNDEDGLKVDLYTYLEYGTSVPKVAMAMQERVKQQVLFMTDVALQEVNIHVVGVVAEKMEQPTLQELFNDEEEENE
ncbi:MULTISPECIES: Asp23/Gls24 family envelope stress response protein [Enterococcus]|uniref:Asp23/Gls24 family envelope stress response protein n=1 Tax=Enterococcus alishanensis TaxID=1303817 RepID=A0ABS6TA68_9ENTE|nr:Asp23/Gls24 family envelope stress response protein [Enterococcus alishanensis]MBV7389799.1 Asp23/Gls24 family envelope stress response protein [Enterococcus alishanensis]